VRPQTCPAPRSSGSWGCGALRRCLPHRHASSRPLRLRLRPWLRLLLLCLQLRLLGVPRPLKEVHRCRSTGLRRRQVAAGGAGVRGGARLRWVLRMRMLSMLRMLRVLGVLLVLLLLLVLLP